MAGFQLKQAEILFQREKTYYPMHLRRRVDKTNPELGGNYLHA